MSIHVEYEVMMLMIKFTEMVDDYTHKKKVI
jgi:hypothetical protein